MKRLSAALFVVLFVAPIALAQDAPKPASTPAKQDATVPAIKYDKDGVTPNPGFMTNHEKFVAQAKQGGIDLLFLGDSITAGWAKNGKDVWAKHYSQRNPANFGIGGDRTQHVLWRIENGELENIKPKVVVLMIGTNNSGADEADRIAEGVTKIVKTVREKTGAKVLLLAVFPRGASDKAPADSTDPKAAENAKKIATVREKIGRINQTIAKLDDGKDVRYLDLKDKFMQPDGTISKEIMYDYLHLTPEGYGIWAESMEPLLKEMLGQ